MHYNVTISDLAKSLMWAQEVPMMLDLWCSSVDVACYSISTYTCSPWSWTHHQTPDCSYEQFFCLFCFHTLQYSPPVKSPVLHAFLTFSILLGAGFGYNLLGLTLLMITFYQFLHSGSVVCYRIARPPVSNGIFTNWRKQNTLILPNVNYKNYIMIQNITIYFEWAPKSGNGLFSPLIS